MELPLTGGGRLVGEWSADPLSYISNDQLFESESFEESRLRRDYRPQDHPELPFEIAKIATASDDEILLFVQRWGVLGHVALRPLGVEGGEPLAWIRAHGGRMRLCIDLADPLHNKDSDSATRALRQFFEQDPEVGRWEDLLRWHLFRGEGRPESEPIERALANNSLNVARLMTEELVNELIEGVVSRLEVNEEEGPRRGFYFSAMIQVAYLHVANLLSERAKIGYCDECGSPFKKTDGRQRFCPPVQFKRESASKCGNRQRYRTWSKKPRKGKQK